MEYDDYPNYNSTWDREFSKYPLWEMTMMNVLQGIAMVCGILVNAFLVVLSLVTPRLKTVSGTILLQRAITDIATLVPFTYVIHTRATDHLDIVRSETACKVFSVILHVGVVASNVLLMAFTLDCYLSSRPQEFPLRFRRKAFIMTSVVAWLLAVIAGVVAGILSTQFDSFCNFFPLFDFSFDIVTLHIIQCFILLIIPLVVVWVLVSVALPPGTKRAALTESSEEGERGPNRRLMLGLAANFTVTQGLYWLTNVSNHIVDINVSGFDVFIIIMNSMVLYMEFINGVLVIYLTPELLQKATKWLPGRHSDSLPLHNM